MTEFLPPSGPVGSLDDARHLAVKWLQEREGRDQMEISDDWQQSNDVYLIGPMAKGGGLILGAGWICVDGLTGLTDMPFGSGEPIEPEIVTRKFRRMIDEGKYA